VGVDEVTEGRLSQTRPGDENFGDAGEVIANRGEKLLLGTAGAAVLPRIVDVILHLRDVRALRIELLNARTMVVDQDHGA
jgi:hypothetical protein